MDVRRLQPNWGARPVTAGLLRPSPAGALSYHPHRCYSFNTNEWEYLIGGCGTQSYEREAHNSAGAKIDFVEGHPLCPILGVTCAAQLFTGRRPSKLGRTANRRSTRCLYSDYLNFTLTGQTERELRCPSQPELDLVEQIAYRIQLRVRHIFGYTEEELNDFPGQDLSLIRLFEGSCIEFSGEKSTTIVSHRVRSRADVNKKAGGCQFSAFSADMVRVVIHIDTSLCQFLSDGRRWVVSIFIEKLQDSLVCLAQPPSVSSHISQSWFEAIICAPKTPENTPKCALGSDYPFSCFSRKQLCSRRKHVGVGTTRETRWSDENDATIRELGSRRSCVPVVQAPARDGSAAVPAKPCPTTHETRKSVPTTAHCPTTARPAAPAFSRSRPPARVRTPSSPAATLRP